MASSWAPKSIEIYNRILETYLFLSGTPKLPFYYLRFNRSFVTDWVDLQVISLVDFFNQLGQSRFLIRSFDWDQDVLTKMKEISALHDVYREQGTQLQWPQLLHWWFVCYFLSKQIVLRKCGHKGEMNVDLTWRAGATAPHVFRFKIVGLRVRLQTVWEAGRNQQRCSGCSLRLGNGPGIQISSPH